MVPAPPPSILKKKAHYSSTLPDLVPQFWIPQEVLPERRSLVSSGFKQSRYPQTPISSFSTLSSVPEMMHLISPLPPHVRHVTFKNMRMKQKLEDIDSEELLVEDTVGERSISHLDFDVNHKPEEEQCDSFSKANHTSCNTVETAHMSYNEWCGGGGCGGEEEEDSSDDNDEDVQSFANCSPLPSGRAYLSRGEWLTDMMISKDMSDPTYATRWVYSSSEGSCQHLELDIRVLKENRNNNNNNFHHHNSMDIKRAASEGMVGKLSHLIGSNPLNLSSSNFKRRVKKTPRRFSTAN